MELNGTKNNQRRGFLEVEGVIVEIEPTRLGGSKPNGCVMFCTVEDMDGNIVNFIITPSTYVHEFEQLKEGMHCYFFHRADVPVPLIYPPQYSAAVIAQVVNGEFINVGYYNNSLVNDQQTLQLHIDSSTSVVTTNNQVFLGSPAAHNLAVVYHTTTRSIPAQTTPSKVIVLCD